MAKSKYKLTFTYFDGGQMTATTKKAMELEKAKWALGRHGSTAFVSNLKSATLQRYPLKDNKAVDLFGSDFNENVKTLQDKVNLVREEHFRKEE